MEGQLHVSATDITHPRIKLDNVITGPCPDMTETSKITSSRRSNRFTLPQTYDSLARSRHNGQLHMRASILHIATVGNIRWFKTPKIGR
jgi:hypothetical protein